MLVRENLEGLNNSALCALTIVTHKCETIISLGTKEVAIFQGCTSVQTKNEANAFMRKLQNLFA